MKGISCVAVSAGSQGAHRTLLTCIQLASRVDWGQLYLCCDPRWIVSRKNTKRLLDVVMLQLVFLVKIDSNFKIKNSEE